MHVPFAAGGKNMYPIKNFSKLKKGYRFKEKTWYSPHHLGLDLIIPVGTPIYAPFDGEVIKQINGKQGGLTVWYKPKHDNVFMRFMHNSKYGKMGKVKEGEIIAFSGNTGSATTGAHSHLDISKNQIVLTAINNFVDPEKYQWELPKKAPAQTKKPKAAPTPTPTTKVAPATTSAFTERVVESNKTIDGTKIEQPNLPEKPDSSNIENIPSGATYTANTKIPENVQVYEPGEFWKTLLKVIISLFKRK